MDTPRAPSPTRRKASAAVALTLLLLAVGLAYAFSNPLPSGHFDYQLRIAEALLRGRLGIAEHPSWLNELVPDPRGRGEWYSVFPLGSVLCLLPVALVKRVLPPSLWVNEDVRWTVAALAVGIAYFLFRLTARAKGGEPGADAGELPLSRRLTLTGFALFGTWLWPNLTYGGAWHLALGFAVLGQAGALYYTLRARSNPWAAGFWFAVAFGNRTEVLLTAPLFLYLLARPGVRGGLTAAEAAVDVSPRARLLSALLAFLAIPALLGVLTLAYNASRFNSPADFGYARIPGLLREPWYRDGFTSLFAIPLNLHSMLLEAAWRVQTDPPYFLPNPMGGSIFASSPFLALLFASTPRKQRQSGDVNAVNAATSPRFDLIAVCWTAVGVLTLALWLHGNQGGWQFTYRYALVLLPWLVLLLREKITSRPRATEVVLLALSFLLNAAATYFFYWTHLVHV